MVRDFLEGNLTNRSRDLLTTFINDARNLGRLYRQAQSQNHSFLAIARNELASFFEPERYEHLESEISKEFAVRCLTDWQRAARRIAADRSLLLSSLECPKAEAAKLMGLVEHLAMHYDGSSAPAILSDLHKFRGFALVSEHRIREAENCFSEAYRWSVEHDLSIQHQQYLLFFRELTAHRADWLDLEISSAKAHLHNALRTLGRTELNSILKGYYWGYDDLKRDEQLLSATEAAARGDASAALTHIGTWLDGSVDISNTSPRFHHIKIVELALRWLTASTDEQLKNRAMIRPEMMARLEGRDIRLRSDLYCVHLLDRANVGENPTDLAQKLARVVSPDAFPPEGAELATKYVAQEIAFRAKELLFLPEWIATWSMPTRARWEQEYALQVYAGVISEFWFKVVTGQHPPPSELFPVWSGTKHARAVLGRWISSFYSHKQKLLAYYVTFSKTMRCRPLRRNRVAKY